MTWPVQVASRRVEGHWLGRPQAANFSTLNLWMSFGVTVSAKFGFNQQIVGLTQQIVGFNQQDLWSLGLRQQKLEFQQQTRNFNTMGTIGVASIYKHLSIRASWNSLTQILSGRFFCALLKDAIPSLFAAEISRVKMNQTRLEVMLQKLPHVTHCNWTVFPLVFR